MADTRLTVLDYRRANAQGLTRDDDAWAAFIDKDDALGLVIDWTRWLGTETISSMAYTSHGVTSANQAEASGVTTATLTFGGGIGTLDVQATTSTGRKMTQSIRLIEIDATARDRYAA